MCALALCAKRMFCYLKSSRVGGSVELKFKSVQVFSEPGFRVQDLVLPRLVALHEPEHCRVGELHVPDPKPFATFPVTLATCPNRSNCKATTPRELIWPAASMVCS